MDKAFLEPFALAACDTLREMANTEIMLRSMTRSSFSVPEGNVAAVMRFESGMPGDMVLSFPARTAANTARRILGDIAELNDALIKDCVGEIANVVAGQAKARLAETPFRVSMSLPTFASSPLPAQWPETRAECHTLVFGGELGEFTINFLDNQATL